MTEQAEVRLKLVLDKAAQDASRKLLDELKGVKSTVVETSDKTKGLGADVTATMTKWGQAAKASLDPMKNLSAAGDMARKAIGGVAAVGAGALLAGAVAGAAAVYATTSAAFERAERVKALTATMISLSPNKNVSYGTANEAAKAYDADFRKIAIASSSSSEEVAKAFEVVAAQVNVGGNMFGQFGARARLTLADTEKIAGNMAAAARVVPGGLGKLTEEYEQLKSGIFGSQGAIVQLITTTGVLKGNAVEVARQLASKDTITRMKLAEEAMARMAKQSAAMPVGMEGLKTTLGEVKDLTFSSIGEPIVNALMPALVGVRTYLVENADKIEMVASKVGRGIADFVEGGSKIVSTLYSAFTDEGSALGETVMKAFGYAREAWGWIVNNSDALSKTFRDVFNVILSAIKKTYDLLEAAAVKLGMANGEDDKMTPDAFKSMRGAAVADAGSRKMSDKETNLTALRVQQSAKEAGFGTGEVKAYVQEIYDAQEMFKKSVAGFDTAAQSMNGADFVDAYNKAMVEHNEAAMTYAQSILKGNSALQVAMLSSGKDIEGGFSSLAKALGDNEFLQMARGLAKSALGTKAMAPQIHFNGATFQIKQDFRDQDPDRVALVFKQQIMDTATRRVQAHGATLFGM